MQRLSGRGAHDRILRRLNRKERMERRDSGQKELGLALAAGPVLRPGKLANLELTGAMTMIQVNVISGLPHLCTQRLEIFHRFSFAFSAFFAVEPIWLLRTVQTKRTQRKPRGEAQSLGSLDTFCVKTPAKPIA